MLTRLNMTLSELVTSTFGTSRSVSAKVCGTFSSMVLAVITLIEAAASDKGSATRVAVTTTGSSRTMFVCAETAGVKTPATATDKRERRVLREREVVMVCVRQAKRFLTA